MLPFMRGVKACAGTPYIRFQKSCSILFLKYVWQLIQKILGYRFITANYNYGYMFVYSARRLTNEYEEDGTNLDV